VVMSEFRMKIISPNHQFTHCKSTPVVNIRDKGQNTAHLVVTFSKFEAKYLPVNTRMSE